MAEHEEQWEACALAYRDTHLNFIQALTGVDLKTANQHFRQNMQSVIEHGRTFMAYRSSPNVIAEEAPRSNRLHLRTVGTMNVHRMPDSLISATHAMLQTVVEIIERAAAEHPNLPKSVTHHVEAMRERNGTLSSSPKPNFLPEKVRSLFADVRNWIHQNPTTLALVDHLNGLD